MPDLHKFAVSVLALLLAGAAYAAKEFVMPVVSHARSYPAHDEHVQEKVTIGIDPYDNAVKAEIFEQSYLRHQFLPVLLVISNDGDEPVSLTGMKVQLITSRRVKLEPATEDDVLRRVAGHGTIAGSAPPVPSPLPIPRKRPRSARGQADAELEAAMFHARAVESHGKQAGFLFFDVRDISAPLPGARLIVQGVKTGEGQELWFFEIPLEKYLISPR